MKALTEQEVEEARLNVIKNYELNDEIKKRLANSNSSFESQAIMAFQLIPQVYGPLIEGLAKTIGGYAKINPSFGVGDLDTSNKCYEFKCGMFDKTGNTNIPQCRNYQNFDGYIVYKYDPFGNEHYIFLLPKKIVTELCLGINSSTHGTKESNKENKNVEKSLVISINKKHKVPYARFLQLLPYRLNSFEDVIKQLK